MTIDKRFNTNRPTPMPHEPLPAFAPVPRQCIRHDGWTPERQRGFIEALADTGSVKAAAHRVNMTPEGAYLLRRHPEGHEFRTAWEAALKLGVQRLEDVAAIRCAQQIGILGKGHCMAWKSPSTTSAQSSGRGGSITIAC